MVNWVGKCFGLPNSFLFNRIEDGISAEDSKGGGSIQDSASLAILTCLLAARDKHLRTNQKNLSLQNRDKEQACLKPLVAYASTEAHSCIEKAALISLVHLRPVKPDANFTMRGAALEKEIQKDLANGKKPFFVLVTLGTTGVAAFDNLKEVVEVAKKYEMWVHVDGAYGGNFFVCPEYR